MKLFLRSLAVLVAVSQLAVDATSESSSIQPALDTPLTHKNDDQQHRQPILVIGAGLPRTGTTSLVEALDRLGLKAYNVRRHMQTPEHIDLWHRFQVLQEISLQQLLDRVQHDGFNVTFGLLATHYQELMELYPDAPVILTVRSEANAAQAWAKSIVDTIANVPTAMSSIPFCWIPLMRKHAATIQSMFQRQFSTARSNGQLLPSRLPYDYDAWNEQVKRTVPPERLLVHAAKDGWEPLCQFLSPLSPEIADRCDRILASGEPYPRVSDSNMFRRLFIVLRVVTVLTYAVPVVVGWYGLRCYWKRGGLARVKGD